jgi:hypothetical protein
LSGALAIAFGLVGIDFAHALKEIVDIGTIDFGGGRAASGSGCIGASAGGTSFLSLIGHRINLVPVCYSSTGIRQVTSSILAGIYDAGEKSKRRLIGLAAVWPCMKKTYFVAAIERKSG